MTVSELLSRMGNRELVEWMAYYRMEPWGEERADLRAGIVASTIANVNRAKKQKPYSPLDFMPFRLKEKDKPLGQRIREAFRNLEAEG